MDRTALLLAALLLGGCGESHGVDASSGEDAGPVDCPPEDPPYACVSERCCTGSVAPERRADCGFGCPAGTTPDAICDPEAGCVASTCTRNDECVLAANDCCGPCGEPSLSDLSAIHVDDQEAHRAEVCPDPDAVVCAGCPSALNPDLGARCDAGACEGYDVRALALSECTADDECRVRVRECCPCGGDTSPWSLIAVRVDAEADYQALVCDEIACPECEPIYPDTVEAFCAADGHCDVRSR